MKYYGYIDKGSALQNRIRCAHTLAVWGEYFIVARPSVRFGEAITLLSWDIQRLDHNHFQLHIHDKESDEPTFPHQLSAIKNIESTAGVFLIQQRCETLSAMIISDPYLMWTRQCKQVMQMKSDTHISQVCFPRSKYNSPYLMQAPKWMVTVQLVYSSCKSSLHRKKKVPV